MTVASEIIEKTAQEHGLTVPEMLGPLRTSVYIRARYMACVCLRDICGKSYPEIGTLLNRATATVHRINLHPHSPKYRVAPRKVILEYMWEHLRLRGFTIKGIDKIKKAGIVKFPENMFTESEYKKWHNLNDMPDLAHADKTILVENRKLYPPDGIPAV